MNPYRKVIEAMALDAQSQGPGLEHSWAYMLFSALAEREDADPTSPAYPSNPIKEVQHQLAAYSNTFAGQRLAQLLNRYIDRYPFK